MAEIHYHAKFNQNWSICCGHTVRTEILSTLHARVKYIISVLKVHSKCHSNQWAKETLKHPLPLGDVNPI